MSNRKEESKNREKNDLSEIRIGDTIKLHYKFTEKDKERVQAFKGVVIARKGSGISENITVRGPVAGVMMEKIIPVYSPNIKKTEIIKKGKVRRAKLYYLRNVIGKKAKLKRRIEKPSSESKKEED